GGAGGTRPRSTLLLPRGPVRHLRDGGVRRRAGAPGLRLSARAAAAAQDHAGVRLARPLRAPGARPLISLHDTTTKETRPMLTRRQFVQGSAAGLALAGSGLSATASAQALETAKIVIGFAPGGTIDLTGRRIADKLAPGYAKVV